MQRVLVANKYQEIANRLNGQISGEPDSFILGTPIEEIADYYYFNNHYDTLEINEEASESVEIKKSRQHVPASQREGPFQSMGDISVDASYIILTIPLRPNPQLDIIKNFEPSIMVSGFSSGDVSWDSHGVSSWQSHYPTGLAATALLFFD